MDRTGANFYRCVDMIVKRLGARPLVCHLPFGEGENFDGIIDLIEEKLVKWDGTELGAKFAYYDIPDDYKEKVEEYKMQMIETAVEADEKIMDKYLNGEEITKAELKKCIRSGVLKYTFVPVFCGSAFKNKGVQLLLDAVCDYLPSPLDLPSVTGIDPKTEKEDVRKASDTEPFSALAFKIMNDPFVGSITFIRIYSGKLHTGVTVDNTTKEKKERIGRMLLMHANNREDIKEASAGDIVALAGLKCTTTGDTLCDPAKPIILERMEFPEPVIEVSVEPKTVADQDKMSIAIGRLAAEDPSLRVDVNKESNQTILKGMGELHLEIIVDRMKREFGVEAKIGAPQVAYRETITKEIEIDYQHKKQTGGAGQYAKLTIKFTPGEVGSGYVFEDKIFGGSIPKEYIPGVIKGLDSAQKTGLIAGYPVIDFKAALLDGAYHEVDSSSLAFEIAARAAFRQLASKGGVKLLEPIMSVEVVTPEEYMGDVIGDINSRRGQILGMEARGNAQVVSAEVPLANMFGYVNSLRSLSQGRAQYTMKFAKYNQVPDSVAKVICEKFQSSKGASADE